LHASQDVKKILACRGTELEERLSSCEEWYRSRLDQAVANNATGCLSSGICSDLCRAQLFLKWTDLFSSGEGWWGTPQVGVVIGMAWYVVTLATWHQPQQSDRFNKSAGTAALVWDGLHSRLIHIS